MVYVALAYWAMLFLVDFYDKIMKNMMKLMIGMFIRMQATLMIMNGDHNDKADNDNDDCNDGDEFDTNEQPAADDDKNDYYDDENHAEDHSEEM